MSISLSMTTQFLPGLVFIKNNHLEFIAASNELARHAGLLSAEHMLGKNDFDMPWPQFADLYRNDDQRVLEGEKIEKFEPFTSKGNHVYISVKKSPIIENNKIVGVGGVIQILLNDIQKELDFLRKHDQKFNSSCQTSYELKKNFTHLTHRESEILFYFLRGGTIKSIALKLSISPRTVETHVTHIKEKLKVTSKSQLIELAFDLGFLHIIPWVKE